MIVRRRPLLRAAVVGGGAYVAGKKVAQHSAQESQQEAEQDERISKLEGGEQGGRAEQGDGGAQRAGGPAGGPSMSDQLKQLSALHEQGALSDEEFAAAKAKLLGL